MNTFHSWRALPCTILTAIALLSAGCGGGDSDPISPPPAITISITPATVTVNGGASQGFTATLVNASNNAVTWSASGGTIQGNGTSATWTAPMSGGPFTITATSAQDPTKSASATATITAPAPVSVSITPTSATVAAGATQEFTATVANSTNNGVTWTSTGGTIAGSGNTMTWTAPVAGGSYAVTATSSADPTKSATVNITVPSVVVSVTPSSPTVAAGGTQTFIATVTGASDNTVTWSATGGTIAGSGATVTWTAPIGGGSFNVVATSSLDPGSSSSATVTVTPIGVSISPNITALFRGEPTVFTATVTGAAAGFGDVTWTSTCGTATPSGLTLAYVAPMSGSCTITATSVSDASRSASTTIAVRTETLVTVTDDVNDGACNYAHCSLREAIIAANATPGADVILLSPNATIPASSRARVTGNSGSAKRVMSNARAVTGTITLTSALPDITTPMTIAGPGPTQLTIHANASPAAQRRVFTVIGQIPFTIAGMTLTGGRANFGGGALLVQSGANVTVDNVVISGNETAFEQGGGIRVFGASTLHLENVVLENNRGLASWPGGAIGVTGSVLTMRGGAIRNNTSEQGFGGGVYGVSATIDIEGTTISGNRGASGGGIAMWNGLNSLTLVDVTIRDNESLEVGGGIIAGANLTTPINRSTVVMDNVVVHNNSTGVQGGGIQFTRNVAATLNRVTITGNTVTRTSTGFPVMGGGIMIGATSQILIDHSTIADNVLAQANASQSRNGGGGISMIAEDQNTFLTLRNSTVSGNRMEGTNEGGGIRVGQGELEIINSTISGNSATRGGGILTAEPIAFRNVTIIGNTATTIGGGLMVDDDDGITLSNVLLSNNTTGTGSPTPSNCLVTSGGWMTSAGYNLSDDATCTAFDQSTDKPNTTAGISPTLADNGGPTRTHALLAGSAAINAGNPAICTATDQRGVARQGVCDIGAFEFVAAGATFRALMAPSALPRRPAIRMPVRPPGVPAVETAPVKAEVYSRGM